jgi:hypothetical protein
MPTGANSSHGTSFASIRSIRITSLWKLRTRAIACSRVTDARTGLIAAVDGEADGIGAGAATSFRREASAEPAATVARASASTRTPRTNRITSLDVRRGAMFRRTTKEAGSRRPLYIYV